eukprot:GHVQ01025083.1.p1 GENE.GHVQ01025083.1~~GHVQ01025083.1.p1  ORF type:complete len:1118 (-),score=212.63 GHVQ01025083.1:269-3622(-)
MQNIFRSAIDTVKNIQQQVDKVYEDALQGSSPDEGFQVLDGDFGGLGVIVSRPGGSDMLSSSGNPQKYEQESVSSSNVSSSLLSYAVSSLSNSGSKIASLYSTSKKDDEAIDDDVDTISHETESVPTVSDSLSRPERRMVHEEEPTSRVSSSDGTFRSHSAYQLSESSTQSPPITVSLGAPVLFSNDACNAPHQAWSVDESVAAPKLHTQSINSDFGTAEIDIFEAVGLTSVSSDRLRVTSTQSENDLRVPSDIACIRKPEESTGHPMMFQSVDTPNSVEGVTTSCLPGGNKSTELDIVRSHNDVCVQQTASETKTARCDTTDSSNSEGPLNDRVVFTVTDREDRISASPSMRGDLAISADDSPVVSSGVATGPVEPADTLYENTGLHTEGDAPTVFEHGVRVSCSSNIRDIGRLRGPSVPHNHLTDTSPESSSSLGVCPSDVPQAACVSADRNIDINCHVGSSLIKNSRDLFKLSRRGSSESGGTPVALKAALTHPLSAIARSSGSNTSSPTSTNSLQHWQTRPLPTSHKRGMAETGGRPAMTPATAREALLQCMTRDKPTSGECATTVSEELVDNNSRTDADSCREVIIASSVSSDTAATPLTEPQVKMKDVSGLVDLKESVVGDDDKALETSCDDDSHSDAETSLAKELVADAGTLKSRIAELKENLAEAAQKLSARERQVQQQSEQLSKFYDSQHDQTSMSVQMAQLQQKLMDAQEEAVQLQSQVAAGVSECKRYKLESDKIRQERDEYKDEGYKLSKRLGTVEESCRKTKTELKASEKRNDGLMKQLNSLQDKASELDQKSSSCGTLEREKQDLENELADTTRKLKSAVAEIKDVKEQMKQTQKNLKGAEETEVKLKRAQSHIESLTQKNRELTEGSQQQGQALEAYHEQFSEMEQKSEERVRAARDEADQRTMEAQAAQAELCMRTGPLSQLAEAERRYENQQTQLLELRCHNEELAQKLSSVEVNGEAEVRELKTQAEEKVLRLVEMQQTELQANAKLKAMSNSMEVLRQQLKTAEESCQEATNETHRMKANLVQLEETERSLRHELEVVETYMRHRYTHTWENNVHRYSHINIWPDAFAVSACYMTHLCWAIHRDMFCCVSHHHPLMSI